MSFFDELKKLGGGAVNIGAALGNQANIFDGGKTFDTTRRRVQPGSGRAPNSLVEELKRKSNTAGFQTTPKQYVSQYFPGPYSPQVLAPAQKELDRQVTNYDNQRISRISDLTDQIRSKSGFQRLLTAGSDVFNANSELDRIKRLQQGRDELAFDPRAPGQSRSGLGQFTQPFVGGLGKLGTAISGGSKQVLGQALRLLPTVSDSPGVLNELGQNLASFGRREQDQLNQKIDTSRFSTLPRVGERGPAVQLGSAASSFVPSIALGAYNPTIAAALLGSVAGVDQLNQASDAGMGAFGQLKSFAIGTAVEGALEKVGLERYFKGSSAGGLLKNVLSRAVTEGTQEFSQSIGGAVVSDKFSGQSVDYTQAFKQALLEGGYGAILGGPGSVIIDSSAKALQVAQRIAGDPQFNERLKNKIKDNMKLNQVGGYDGSTTDIQPDANNTLPPNKIQTEFIKGYADLLESMDADAGVTINSDGTRSSSHSPFYRDTFAQQSRAPTKAQWLEEAQRQIDTGVDASATEEYNSLATDPALASSVDDLVQKATAINPHFQQSVSNIGKALGMKYKSGPIKSADRIIEKVNSKYAGDVSRINDAVRSTLSIDNPYSTSSVIGALSNAFEIVDVDNTFARNNTGYKDIQVKVKLPNGILGEVIITTPEMLRAKNELGGHKLYKKIRIKVDGWEKLLVQMNKLYADADSALATRLAASASDTSIPLTNAGTGGVSLPVFNTRPTTSPLSKSTLTTTSSTLKNRGNLSDSVDAIKTPFTPTIPQNTPNIKPGIPRSTTKKSRIPGAKSDLGFIETVKSSPKTSPGIASAINGEGKVITNKQTIAKAASDIKKMGSENAINEAKTTTNFDTDTQARSLQLIHELQAVGRDNDAIDIIEAYADRARKGGQATQIAAVYGMLTPKGVLAAAQRQISNAKKSNPTRYRDLKLTEEQSKLLYEMAKKVQAMKPGNEKIIEQVKLQDEILKVVPTPTARKAATLWKAGLLTGIKGGVFGNTVGNGAFQIIKKISDVPSTAIDIAISQATGQRSKAFTLRGIVGGAIRGSKVGFQDFKSGVGATDVSAKLDYVKTFYSDSKLGRAAQLYTDAVFNFYSAADKPFYYAALENSLQERARVEVKNKGLRGKDAEAFINETVKNPPSDMNEAAVNDALTLVFQNRNTLGSALSNLKRGARDRSATGEVVGEVILPFTGVPSNIATAVYNYSPVGAVVDVYNSIKKARSGNFDQAQQRQLSESLGKGMTGTGIIWLGTKLVSAGLMTLGYPNNDDERALWESEGKTPYSINIGGSWESMNYTGPVMSLLAIGGEMQNARQGGSSGYNSIIQGAAASGKSIIGSSPLQGVQGALDAVTDPKRYAGRFFNNLVGSTVPTIVKDVAIASDPTQRQVNNPIDSIKSRIPGARQTLSPRVGTFGQEKKRKTSAIGSIIDPFKSSSVTSTPLSSELRRLYDGDNTRKVTPTKVTGKGWGIENMSDGQKQSITRAVMPEVEKRWSEVIKQDRYKRLSDDDKNKLLQKEQQAIVKARKSEFKALDKTGQEKWVNNATLRWVNSNAVNEKGFLNMLATNAKAWATSPKTALSYLGKEKILRTNNGAIIIERLPVSESQAIRDKRGATKEMKLDHTVSLQLGGSNDESNLKLVPTEVHKSYNAMENAVGDRLVAGQINGSQAKRDIIALKNGDMTLKEYIGSKPGDTTIPKINPSSATSDSGKSGGTADSTGTAVDNKNYYNDKYNKALEKLNNPDENLTAVQRFALKDKIESLKVKKGYSKDIIDLYSMSKSDAFDFLQNASNGDKLAEQLVNYGDDMVSAGIWGYNKFRDKYGNVSIRPKTSKRSLGSSKKQKKPIPYKSNLTGAISQTKKLRNIATSVNLGQFKLDRKV